MKKNIISRYLSQETFNAVCEDFKFLINKIIQSGFEYDLQIRDNYLNLYYKGNSIGKIAYKRLKKLYEIKIHYKFIEGLSIEKRFKPLKDKDYLLFSLDKKQLHPFFSLKNLTSMGQKVKKVQFQEEIVFEQILLTDNVNRKDLIIIDRQIMDKAHSTKMDLLGLKKESGNNFRFCVLEVKLGNNSELRGKVFNQLQGYVRRIEKHFTDYKKCYELNIRQKKGMGLLDKSLSVNIIKGVLGVVVVGGYSGVADDNIKALKKKHPGIKIIPIKNKIDFNKTI